MCKITAVFNNQPVIEVDQPCLDECLSIVHTFAKAYDQQADCYDDRGRLVARVAPGAQDIMPWVNRLPQRPTAGIYTVAEFQAEFGYNPNEDAY